MKDWRSWDPDRWTDVKWADLRFIGFGATLVFWSGIGQTYLIGFFGEELRTAFNLTDGGYGQLYGFATLASGFVILWSGGLIDRLRLGTVATIVAAGAVIAGLTMAATPHWVFLLLSFFLLRQFGQALMGHTANAAMGRYYDRFKGRATGMLGMAYSAGELILPLFAALLIGQLALPGALAALEIDLGWRAAFAIMAVLVAVTVFPSMPFLLRDLPQRHEALEARLAEEESDDEDRPGSRRRQWKRGEVLRDHRFWVMIPLIVSMSGFFTGLFFHIVSILNEKGWDPKLWPYYWGFYPIAALVLGPLAGWLTDRTSAQRLYPLAMVPLGIGFIVLGSFTPFWAMLIALMMLALTGSLYNTTFNTLWPELYGVRHLGKIRTLGTTMMVIASASGPIAMGLLKDAGVPFSTQLVGCGVFTLCSCVLAAAVLWRGDLRPLRKK